MSGPETLSTEAASQTKPSWFVRFIVWAGLFIIFALFAAIIAFAAFVWHFRSQHFGALDRTRTLVTEIRAAGEPMTIAELRVSHKVPPDVLDSTTAWTHAMATFDAQELKSRLEVVMPAGQAIGTAIALDEEHSAKAKDLLSEYRPTLDAASLAAATEGECRLPFDSKDYFNSSTNNAMSIRSLGHLLALEARMTIAARDTDGAIASLTSLFALSEAVKHQPSMTEQGARLNMLKRGFEESNYLLSNLKLNRDQLQSLTTLVETCDLSQNLTVGLIGERAMMYEFFLESTPPGAVQFGRGPPTDREPGLAHDCEYYLDYTTRLIAASRIDFPIALDMAEAIEVDFHRAASEWGPIKKRQITQTPQDFDLRVLEFRAQGRTLVLREAVRVLIALRLYELDKGNFPSSLDQLVPDFLPNIPIDPFDGNAIRAKFEADEIVVYSVGPDRIDNGGRPEIDSSGDMALRLKAAANYR